ncbi:MAG: S1 RNA-binding domain-containing protein [Kiritimatiellae bacterium]|nr:S1 RNA-binding domain-containing protein [Kiritimatiellia bacterium]
MPKFTHKPSARMAEFEALLNAQTTSFRTGFNPGEKVQGRVISSRGGYIVLDVGAKNEGLVPMADFTNEKGRIPVKIGDSVSVVFVTVQNGAFLFSAKDTSVAIDQTLAQARESGLPVEGRVQSEVNGGYEVTVAGHRAFCPYSQIAMYRQKGAAYVGQTLQFIVQEYDPEERNIVVSRRALQERERDRKREELKSNLVEGATCKGKVTRIVDFGFFVDLGGAEGLVPLKEISWRRDVKPEDVVKVGDTVEVLVREIDWERNRISLSLRGAETDPFDLVAERSPAGSNVTAKITRLEPFGAFAELEPGVEGLIPISALGNGRRIARPSEVVEVGQEMVLKVESIDRDRRRISLRPIWEDEEAAKAAAEAAEVAKAMADFKKASTAPADISSIGSMLDSLKL